MHTSRRKEWEKIVSKKNSNVFVDREHGVYDKRLEYGRVLSKPQQQVSSAAEERMLWQSHEKNADSKYKKVLIASVGKKDSLSCIQKQLTVVSKKKRKVLCGSGPRQSTAMIKKREKFGNVQEMLSSSTEKKANSSVLQNLGQYGSESDSDSDSYISPSTSTCTKTSTCSLKQASNINRNSNSNSN